MQVNPYLSYDGNCGAALNFYQKVLGARIEETYPYGEGNPEMQTPPGWKDKIMHARVSIDGEIIMASDAPPQHFQKPQGFSLSLTVNDPAEAERKFNALCKGGAVTMAWSKTFFAKGFGIGVDQFGIPWMVISPMEQ